MIQRLRFYLALYVAKLTVMVIDLVAKGRGTNLPGAIALKIDPRFLAHFKGIDPDKAIFITGTNGKSTTTNLLNRILTEAGCRVISNLDGANMTAGVAVPLIRHSSLTGRVDCDYLVMETDERYVSRIRQQIPARYLCVTNIQKDQVQRNGEPGFVYSKIRQAISEDVTVFVNQDEPNAACVAAGRTSSIIPYGMECHSLSFRKADDFFTVSMPCPRCHSGLRFSRYNVDHMGVYHCPVCGLENGAGLRYFAHAISFELEQFTLCGEVYPFHYAQPQFLYSYLPAAAIALELGTAPEAIRVAFDSFRKATDRVSTAYAAGHCFQFWKYKQENSETLQMVLNTMARDPGEKALLLGLDEYIDFYPPYLNTCFLYDCDFRQVAGSGVRSWATTSTGLGHSAAVRLLYDGFDPDTMQILPDSSEQTLGKVLEGCENAYLVEEIPFWKRKGS